VVSSVSVPSCAGSFFLWLLLFPREGVLRCASRGEAGEAERRAKREAPLPFLFSKLFFLEWPDLNVFGRERDLSLFPFLGSGGREKPLLSLFFCRRCPTHGKNSSLLFWEKRKAFGLDGAWGVWSVNLRKRREREKEGIFRGAEGDAVASTASDVWMWACTAIEMTTGAPPVPEMSQIEYGAVLLNGQVSPLSSLPTSRRRETARFGLRGTRSLAFLRRPCADARAE
jgi:hypothetical protein